jgi:hypothetical protein
MTRINIIVRALLILLFLLVTMCAVAQAPPVDAPKQTDFQSETHFLTFLGSYVPENIASATAYYKAIDPTGSKQDFRDWLVYAGFIGNRSQWRPTGRQIIACDLGVAAGCDVPAHNPDGSLVYGDNVINTDSHVIVLNAADLGFVRNQFVRCIPSCTAKNPMIFTYLENYPVNAFSNSLDGGTGFPVKTGFPSNSEAARAMNSAITRPSGDLSTCTQPADTGLHCSVARIADVAFDWTPPLNQPTSSTRFGRLYAYIFHDFSAAKDGSNVSETINWFNDQATLDAAFNSRLPGHFPPVQPVKTTDPFAPELDFRGVKQMPGVCLICHGGKPQKLTSTGTFPNGGNINGFRLLPIDISNMKFTSDSGPEATSRANQEAQIKEYNKDVLLTVSQSKEGDGTGSVRGPHLAEVIKGWYAGFAGDQNMTGTTQNVNFVPTGWTGHEQEYLHTVATSCRTCHFNREISLDFGTYANFHQGSDILQLALMPYCNAFTFGYHLDPKMRPMPAALLTYVRYWSNATDPNAIFPSVDLPGSIAVDFGFSSTAGYCATNP